MLNINLITDLGWLLADSLVSLMPVNSSQINYQIFCYLQSASAQQGNFNVPNSLKCEGKCRQLPIGNRLFLAF